VNNLLPLIRIKVDLANGYGKVHQGRFGQRFVGRLANPDEILIFTRKAKQPGSAGGGGAAAAADAGGGGGEDMANLLRNARLNMAQDVSRVEQIMKDILNENNDRTEIVPEAALADALHMFVDKDEKKAIEDLVEGFVGDHCGHLQSLDDDVVDTKLKIHTAAVQHTDDLRKESVHKLLEKASKGKENLGEGESNNSKKGGRGGGRKGGATQAGRKRSNLDAFLQSTTNNNNNSNNSNKRDSKAGIVKRVKKDIVDLDVDDELDEAYDDDDDDDDYDDDGIKPTLIDEDIKKKRGGRGATTRKRAAPKKRAKRESSSDAWPPRRKKN